MFFKLPKGDKSKSGKCYLQIFLFVSLLAIVLTVSVCCIVSGIEDDVIDTESAEIPEDLREGIDDFCNDLILLESSVISDLNTLSKKIKSADTFSDKNEQLFEYYSNNAWIDILIYYDAESDLYYSSPVILNSADVIGSIPYPTERELRKAENNLIENACVFIPEHGYMCMCCKGIFDDNGKYVGYIIMFTDLYVQLNLQPLVIDNEKLYGDYVVFITDKDGRIVYSSRQEAIGQYVEKNNPFYNGEVLIKKTNTESGAYQYSSRAFHSNLRDIDTEKITAWSTIGREKHEYTVYAVKELDRPELELENVFELDTENTLRDVQNLYTYDDWNGIEKSIERVNSGYYLTDIHIVDMNGKVAASTESEIIGLNFINNRGNYGYSYVTSMIDTVKQGGGYVYYTKPIDGTSDTPAAEYCIGYVLPLDENYFVIGRFAGDTDLVIKDYDLRSDVVTVSREIVNEAYYNGIDYVIDKINNQNTGASVFVDWLNTDVSDIAILSFNGELLASINHPEMIDSIVTGYTDAYGGSTARKAIILAKNGGGLMTNLSPNPDKEGYVDLWLISVEPINNRYFSCVGAVIKTFDDLSQYLVS